MTHAQWVAELAAALESRTDCPLVIENEEGEAFEIVDCALENVNGHDQTLLTIARIGRE